MLMIIFVIRARKSGILSNVHEMPEIISILGLLSQTLSEIKARNLACALASLFSLMQHINGLYCLSFQILLNLQILGKAEKGGLNRKEEDFAHITVVNPSIHPW